MTAKPPSLAELELAAVCVENQPNAPALASFAYDVLSTWADGRSLFSGQKFMAERAARCGVNRENASTELGNVLTMLERGARASAEVALISAFAARGWSAAFDAAIGGERAKLAERFVTQLDWIEAGTDYRVTPYIERLLGQHAARGLLDALYRAVLREDTADETVDVAVRARNAARLTVLARARAETAHHALRALRRQAQDPATRALAAALSSEGDASLESKEAAPVGLRVTGVSRTPSRSLPVALLRWLSGFALLQALQQFFCFLVALRRELELELRGEELRVRSRTLFMGRMLGSTEASYEVWRVTGAFRRARFALLRTVVGVLSLSLGVLIGGYLVFDGARGGAPLLLLVGAAVVAAGSSVDLALNVLLPARDASVEVQVDLRGARSLRLGRVEQGDADRLLHALSLRLAR
jgi:hypothetical protein